MNPVFLLIDALQWVLRYLAELLIIAVLAGLFGFAAGWCLTEQLENHERHMEELLWERDYEGDADTLR